MPLIVALAGALVKSFARRGRWQPRKEEFAQGFELATAGLAATLLNAILFILKVFGSPLRFLVGHETDATIFMLISFVGTVLLANGCWAVIFLVKDRGWQTQTRLRWRVGFALPYAFGCRSFRGTYAALGMMLSA